MSPGSSASAWRDADRLLAGALHVERGLALALRDQHAVVEGARQHHARAGRAQQLGDASGRAHGPTASAVVVEHADQRVGEVAVSRAGMSTGGRAHRAGGRPGGGRRNRFAARGARSARGHADARDRGSPPQCAACRRETGSRHTAQPWRGMVLPVRIKIRARRPPVNADRSDAVAAEPLSSIRTPRRLEPPCAVPSPCPLRAPSSPSRARPAPRPRRRRTRRTCVAALKAEEAALADTMKSGGDVESELLKVVRSGIAIIGTQYFAGLRESEARELLKAAEQELEHAAARRGSGTRGRTPARGPRALRARARRSSAA